MYRLGIRCYFPGKLAKPAVSVVTLKVVVPYLINGDGIVVNRILEYLKIQDLAIKLR